MTSHPSLLHLHVLIDVQRLGYASKAACVHRTRMCATALMFRALFGGCVVLFRLSYEVSCLCGSSRQSSWIVCGLKWIIQSTVRSEVAWTNASGILCALNVSSVDSPDMQKNVVGYIGQMTEVASHCMLFYNRTRLARAYVVTNAVRYAVVAPSV